MSACYWIMGTSSSSSQTVAAQPPRVRYGVDVRLSYLCWYWEVVDHLGYVLQTGSAITDTEATTSAEEWIESVRSAALVDSRPVYDGS